VHIIAARPSSYCRVTLADLELLHDQGSWIHPASWNTMQKANANKKRDLKLLIVVIILLTLLIALTLHHPAMVGNVPVPTHRPR